MKNLELNNLQNQVNQLICICKSNQEVPQQLCDFNADQALETHKQQILSIADKTLRKDCGQLFWEELTTIHRQLSRQTCQCEKAPRGMSCPCFTLMRNINEFCSQVISLQCRYNACYEPVSLYEVDLFMKANKQKIEGMRKKLTQIFDPGAARVMMIPLDKLPNRVAPRRIDLDYCKFILGELEKRFKQPKKLHIYKAIEFLNDVCLNEEEAFKFILQRLQFQALCDRLQKN